VGNDLNSLSQVISSSLLLNDLLVDLASGDVAVTAQLDAKVSLVVSKIEIGLAAIIENEALAMLERIEKTSVGVDIRIGFDRRDSKTKSLEKKTSATG